VPKKDTWSVQWFTSIIPTATEAEVRRLVVQDQPV
jgi:hypothetical protein